LEEKEEKTGEDGSGQWAIFFGVVLSDDAARAEDG